MILNRYKEYFSVIDQSLKETIIHNIMILNRPLYHFMILGKKKMSSFIMIYIDNVLYMIT